jgi:ATP-binding cassette subfamily B protein
MSDTEHRNSFGHIIKISKRAFLFPFKYQTGLMLLNISVSMILAGIVYLQLASFSKIVDQIIFIKNNGGVVTKALYQQSIILGLSFLIPAILQSLQSRISNQLRMRNGTDVQLYRIDTLAKLDIGTLESAEFQTKLERASQWGIGCVTNLMMLVVNAIQDITGVIVAAVMMYFINPVLVPIAVVSCIPTYFIKKKYNFQLYSLYHERTDESRIMNNRNSFFMEVRKTVDVILFNLFARFRKDIKESNESFDNKIFAVYRRQFSTRIITAFFDTFCLALVIFIVTKQAVTGNILIGSLLLAFNTYRSFNSTITQFFTRVSDIEDQARYAGRWYELFDIKSKIVNKSNALKPEWQKSPVIEFKNVSFSYPETNVVVTKNISFKLESGEKLAVVGVNGAGKTTLIKLLCRIYDPTEGEILVDGINLKEIDSTYWREHLGVLFQDFANFNMTVREAIAISRPNESIDTERVLKAATMAEADEFIQAFPKKYDQLLWKGYKDGVELSKGQHQRMAVARILYRDALISVLDEPTSAVDAIAEEKIFEVLETKMEGKTVVLISHRFSTVKNADKIAVIEHGVLQEIGNHKELMAKKGRYEELYSMQASRYLESD